MGVTSGQKAPHINIAGPSHHLKTLSPQICLDILTGPLATGKKEIKQCKKGKETGSE